MPLLSLEFARRWMQEPAKDYLWEVVIPKPPALAFPFAMAMTLQARQVSWPGRSVQSYSTNWGPYTFQHPGKKAYSKQVSVQFLETQNPQIVPAFALWHDAVFDEVTEIGIPEESLKSDIWLRQLRTDKDPNLHSAAHIYSAYPINISEPRMDSGGSRLVHFDVSFAYDIWRYELWPF